MPSVQVIKFELDAIVGALTLANNALKRVHGQLPAQPPVMQDEITALNVVVDLSGQLQDAAKRMLSTGGARETPA